MIAIGHDQPSIHIYDLMPTLLIIQSSIVMATNVLLTLVIGSRMLLMRRTLTRQATANPLLKAFTFTAFVVESSVLYTTTGLVYMVGCITQSHLRDFVYPILIQIQVCLFF
jgi:hypothetical protein